MMIPSLNFEEKNLGLILRIERCMFVISQTDSRVQIDVVVDNKPYG